MIKKLICIFIGFCMALVLTQCSPGDVEKESDKIITDLTTNAARKKEAVELSMAEARFKTYTAENISKGTAASTLTVDNQSGEDALVKLIRSDDETLWLPIRMADQAQSSVSVVAGRYYTKVRYGTIGNYRYIKGTPFDSAGGGKTTITVQKVPAENYPATTISADEF